MMGEKGEVKRMECKRRIFIEEKEAESRH